MIHTRERLLQHHDAVRRAVAAGIIDVDEGYRVTRELTATWYREQLALLRTGVIRGDK